MTRSIAKTWLRSQTTGELLPSGKEGDHFFNDADGVLCWVDSTGATQASNIAANAVIGITRAQIPATPILAPVTRFKTVNGAPWIRGTSAGPHAITDALGHWWQLDISSATRLKWWDAALDAVSDDYAAWQGAITWCCAAGTPRTLTVPAGKSRSSHVISAAITGIGSLNLVVEGAHDLFVDNGADGISLMRDYGAGFSLRGTLSLVRNTTTVSEANTAFLLDYNAASAITVAGNVSLETLRCVGAANQVGWNCGAKLRNTSNAFILNFTYLGRNGQAVVEDPTISGYSPATTSTGLWIDGFGAGDTSGSFSIQTNVATIIVQGSHICVRTTGKVQGLFLNNPCLIGADYGLYGEHAHADTTELLAIGGSSTINCAIENIHLTYVGYVNIGASQHNRFAADAGRTWTAIHFHECNTYNVTDQTGTGAGIGTEYGFWDESQDTYLTGQSSGHVTGFGIDILHGAWLRLKGNLKNKTITGCSCNGVGVQDVDFPAANTILGNNINGNTPITTDAGYNTIVHSPNLFTNTILPSSSGLTLGAGGAFTWAQVWTNALIVAGTQVVGVQQTAVANATNATDVITQLNALLARLRAHGLIAT